MNDEFWMDYRSPGLMSSQHKHHQFEVNYIVSGRANYLYTGYQFEMKKGSFNLMWAGLPHQLIDRSDDLVMVWIYLPMETFLACGCGKTFVGRLLQGEIFQDSLNTDELQMVRWYNEYKSQKNIENVLLKEIDSRLRRLEITNRSIKPAIRTFTKKSMERVSLICRYISDHFEEELTVETIANFIGLHPNYMMNLFKNETSYSINHYITRLRISKAQTLLATTDEKVTTILYQSGFQSSSRFYKAFLEITGMTPRDFKLKSHK